MNVSGLQEQPPLPLEESVGPLDHIIQGFEPPPPDFQANTRIEQFTAIQAQLEAFTAREANETPAVPAPVASNERAEDAAPEVNLAQGVQAPDVDEWFAEDFTAAAALNEQPVPAPDATEWPEPAPPQTEPMDTHPEQAPQVPARESTQASRSTAQRLN